MFVFEEFREEYLKKLLALNSELWEALTPAGRRVAHRLALAHGHSWAGFTSEHEAAHGVPLTEIARRTLEAKLPASLKYGIPVGIEYPHCFLGTRCVYHKHTTGSGRLTWEISHEDILFMEVSRPTGERVSFAWEFKECEGDLAFIPLKRDYCNPRDEYIFGSGEIAPREDRFAVFCKRHYHAVVAALAEVINPVTREIHKDQEIELLGHARVFAHLRDFHFVGYWLTLDEVEIEGNLHVEFREEPMNGDITAPLVLCRLPKAPRCEWALDDKVEYFDDLDGNQYTVRIKV